MFNTGEDDDEVEDAEEMFDESYEDAPPLMSPQILFLWPGQSGL